MQGFHARKLFQRCTHFLYCSVLSVGGNVNTRWMSQTDMGSIFHIKNLWNILVIETFMWIIKIQCFYSPRILNQHWCIYSCLLIPPRENWFQYVRWVYATAINFPCIITLGWCIEFKNLPTPRLQGKLITWQHNHLPDVPETSLLEQVLLTVELFPSWDSSSLELELYN